MSGRELPRPPGMYADMKSDLYTEWCPECGHTYRVDFGDLSPCPQCGGTGVTKADRKKRIEEHASRHATAIIPYVPVPLNEKDMDIIIDRSIQFAVKFVDAIDKREF